MLKAKGDLLIRVFFRYYLLVVLVQFYLHTTVHLLVEYQLINIRLVLVRKHAQIFLTVIIQQQQQLQMHPHQFTTMHHLLFINKLTKAPHLIQFTNRNQLINQMQSTKTHQANMSHQKILNLLELILLKMLQMLVNMQEMVIILVKDFTNPALMV